MSLSTTYQAVTAAGYAEIFERERRHLYPMIDAFEARMGFAIERARLEALAFVLACPMKASPPNWQHGRVLYAAARAALARKPLDGYILDIGTAKGFSAMCLQLAVNDAAGARVPVVWSVDVIPPTARVRRNTVAEVDALKTLAEILARWPEAEDVTFVESTGTDWLKSKAGHVYFAFVDGKHTGEAVYQEGLLLKDRQEPGDVVVFDDVHIPGVWAAVQRLTRFYAVEPPLRVLPKRAYAIGVRL